METTSKCIWPTMMKALLMMIIKSSLTANIVAYNWCTSEKHMMIRNTLNYTILF